MLRRSVFSLLVLFGFATSVAAQPQPFVDDVLYPLAVESGIGAALDRFDAAPDATPAALNLLGYRLLQSGAGDPAIDVFEANISRHPQYVNGYDSLAEALIAAGRRDEAAASYRELLDRLPDSEIPANFRARLRFNADMFLFGYERFGAPAKADLHVASFYGGAPAGKWEMENLSTWSKTSGAALSHEGHNLYGSPVPQGVAQTLEDEPRADVSTGFIGGEYMRWVEDGTIADLSELWRAEGWDDAFAEPFRRMASLDGKPYFVPTAFQWNPIWYRSDLFDELGLEVPSSWDELLALCDRLHELDRACFTAGVQNWPPPTARWFTILNLRLNGAGFHSELMGGRVPFTDPRVRNVFEHWQELWEHNAFVDSSFANTYQKAIDDLVSGRALMYNLGEWIYESLPDGYDKLDFFAMPVLNPNVERAEIVHAYGAFMRSDVRNAARAQELLTYLGSEESQTSNAEALGRVNAHRGVDPSVYTDVQLRLLEYVSNEVDVFVPLLEFSTKPEMANAALQAFVQFWENPDDIDGAIEALETARLAAFGS